MKKVLLISLILVLGLAFNVWADLILVTAADYTGSRTTPESLGVIGTGNWADPAGGFKVSWTITHTEGAAFPWTYSYTFTDVNGGPLAPDLSHWIMQVSLGIPLSAFDFAGIFPERYEPKDDDIALGTWLTTDNGNPGLPQNIYGIKFDFGSDTTPTYTFKSTQSPVWGDFYAKDGTGQIAYNTGILVDPTTREEYPAGYFLSWIPTPDTEGFYVPEPSTLLLIGSGLLGLGLFRRRFKK